MKKLTRAVLPAPARRVISRGINYFRRICAWLRVLCVASGRSAADGAVLGRSALRAPIDSLHDLNEWREPQLVADADVRVRGLGTFAIRASSDDLGHVLPFNHAHMFCAMKSLLQPGDVVIDAGANIGAITVFLARAVGPHGRVLAVEMMPETASRLRRNLTLNGLTYVDVVEKALSNREDAIVTAEVPEGLFGQASIALNMSSRQKVQRVQVPATTLDALAQEFQEVALIKMDLEGAEPMVLAGASRTLARTRAVIFESWQHGGCRTAEMLRSAGFQIGTIDGRNFLATRAISSLGG